MTTGGFQEQIGTVVDTLVKAKELHPGKRNSLDALCDRYGISNAHRQLHGALLDAELLADVYLAMSRGQNSFVIDEDAPDTSLNLHDSLDSIPLAAVLVLVADEHEVVLHTAMLAGLDKAVRGHCLWNSVSGE